MTDEKLAEGMAIVYAAISGRCEKCSSYYECMSDEHFKFPFDAYCMKTKAKLLKKWGAEDGK